MNNAEQLQSALIEARDRWKAIAEQEALRADKAEARVRGLEKTLSDVRGALIDADSILSLVAHRNSRGPLTEENRNEMLLVSALCRRLYTSSPMPEPHQGAPGAELEHAGQAIAPAAEAAPAVVAPDDTESDVGADEPDGAGQH